MMFVVPTILLSSDPETKNKGKKSSIFFVVFVLLIPASRLREAIRSQSRREDSGGLVCKSLKRMLGFHERLLAF